jgi:hypothetical protein
VLHLLVALVRIVVFMARVFTGTLKLAIALIVTPIKFLIESFKLLYDYLTGAPGAVKSFGEAVKKLAGTLADFVNPFAKSEEQKKADKAKLQSQTTQLPGYDLLDQAARIFDPFGIFDLQARAKALGDDAKKKKLQQLDTGGITRRDTVAQLHKNEVVIPLHRIGEVTGNMQARSTGSPQPVAPASPGASISLTIPVTVALGELVLGTAMVQLSEERMRREFSARGIRLAGIG